MAFIPPDDFEDIIDHVSIPRRSGGLNDLLNFGRTEFDKITRKVSSPREKSKQNLCNLIDDRNFTFFNELEILLLLVMINVGIKN